MYYYGDKTHTLEEHPLPKVDLKISPQIDKIQNKALNAKADKWTQNIHKMT